MGLDITWYRKLTVAADVTRNEDGEPVDADGKYARHVHVFFDNPDFPGRALGIDCAAAFHAFASGAGPSWSYHGYHNWRQQLAAVAGYNSANELWEGKVTSGPFYELINFSDCEGVIGPIVAAKLAKDFEEFSAAAKEAHTAGQVDSYWLAAFLLMKNAFEQAADSGAVKFH